MATAVRRPREDGYGRTTRFYELPNGKKLPSVTAILQAVNKPALVNWAAKTEREMVVRAAADLYEDLPPVKMARPAYVSTLENRIGKAKAHTKELAKASDIGSECHGMIEWCMRKELLQEVGVEPRISDKATWAFMAYEDWRKKANLSPRLVEQTVWSERYGYAGTLDWAGDIDHQDARLTVVGDFKTGKAVYGEAHLQVAAYGHALVEMGHADVLPAGCIVRLPKIETDPNFEIVVIPADRMKQLHKVFLNVIELWKWMDESR